MAEIQENKIGIVILCYNEWLLTNNCIKSIRDTCKINYHIYIVDNASTEEISEEIKNAINASTDTSTNITLIRIPVSNGFSAGNNVGFKRAVDDGCTHILFTNNDVIFTENSIDILADYLDNNPNVGVVGPKVYTASGKIQSFNLGCELTIGEKYLYMLRKTPLKFLSKKVLKKFEVDVTLHDKPFELFAVSGCCFMINKSATKLIYPFDETTLFYLEEYMLGRKLRDLGLKTIYNVNSVITHIGGETTKKRKALFDIYFTQAEMYYCRKYLKASIIQCFPIYIYRMIAFSMKYGVKNLKNFIIITKRYIFS